MINAFDIIIILIIIYKIHLVSYIICKEIGLRRFLININHSYKTWIINYSTKTCVIQAIHHLSNL